jgi:hypothetical protein
VTSLLATCSMAPQSSRATVYAGGDCLRPSRRGEMAHRPPYGAQTSIRVLHSMIHRDGWKGKVGLLTGATLLALVTVALLGEAVVRRRERHRTILAGTMPLSTTSTADLATLWCATLTTLAGSISTAKASGVPR